MEKANIIITKAENGYIVSMPPLPVKKEEKIIELSNFFGKHQHRMHRHIPTRRILVCYTKDELQKLVKEFTDTKYEDDFEGDFEMAAHL